MKVKNVLLFFMLSILMIVMGCDELIPTEDDLDINPLKGVWEMKSMSTLDSNGQLVVDADGGPNPMVFPMDWVGMVSTMKGDDPVNYDLDGDGENEAVTFSIFVEVTDTIMRLYAKISITDPGTSLSDFLTAASMVPTDMGLPFFESAIKYNSSKDMTYTVTGNTISGMTDGDVTFVISGSTLTITAPEDKDTADTSDDGTMVMVYTSATSSDIAGAVDDTTLTIFD